jgi:hemerythrin superfamily protein
MQKGGPAMTMTPGPIPPVPEPVTYTEATAATPARDEPDVVDVLMADHREVEGIFAELEKPGGSPQRRHDLAQVVIAELVRHSTAEEQHLYPATRKHLPDGDHIAEHEIAEHARAEDVMHQLMKLDADDDTFDHLLAKLISDVRHHIQEEETKLFPRLRDACDRATLVELGRKALAAEKVAPTRPHPAAPDTPPLNKLAGPVMGAVDRAADALTGRPTRPEDLIGRNEPAAPAGEAMPAGEAKAEARAEATAEARAEDRPEDSAEDSPIGQAETTTYRSSSAQNLPPSAEPVSTEPADPDR